MSALTEASTLEMLRVFDSAIEAARTDVLKLSGGTEVSVRMLENLLRKWEGLKGSDRTMLLLKDPQATAHLQLAELFAGGGGNLGNAGAGLMGSEVFLGV
ncbi:MAG: hypothetical protein ACK5TN_02470 [Acidobacteriota bacterium]